MPPSLLRFFYRVIGIQYNPLPHVDGVVARLSCKGHAVYRAGRLFGIFNPSNVVAYGAVSQATPAKVKVGMFTSLRAAGTKLPPKTLFDLFAAMEADGSRVHELDIQGCLLGGARLDLFMPPTTAAAAAATAPSAGGAAGEEMAAAAGLSERPGGSFYPLTRFNGSACDWTGSIPTKLFGGLTASTLTDLDLSNNGLSGEIPGRAISMCSQLMRLSLYVTHLCFPLCITACANCNSHSTRAC